MQAILNNVHTIFATCAAAQLVADSCSAADDDWTYTVVPDPKGSPRAIIKITDEDGEFVANV